MARKVMWGKAAVPKKGTRPALAHQEQAQIEAAALAALHALSRASTVERVPQAETLGTEPEITPVRKSSGWDVEKQRRERITHGRRARRLPVVATAATAATGYAAWGVGELATMATGPAGALAVTGATAALSASVLVGVRIAIRTKIGPWGQRFATATAAAAAWVTTTAAVGFQPAMLAALAGGSVALSTGWLRAHQALLPPDKPQRPELPAAAETTVNGLEDFAARWSRQIARGGQLLPGCHLTGGHDQGHVYEFTLQLVDGRTLAKVREAQEQIASALGLDPIQLTFGDPPLGTNGFRDSSKVGMQMILSSPITGPVYFTGPRFTLTDDGFGLIDLGPYADGRHHARYELFRPSGMFSGVVIGSTGKGKSSVINGTVVSARSSGMVATLYLDPKGNSSPDLARHATIPVLGLDRAELFTRCVEEMVIWLGKKASADGDSVFIPGNRTAYLITIDECDMLFGIKGMGDRWGNIAKTGRSLGVGLLLATQYGGMKAFGNSELLRSSVRAGNVVLMRTESKTSDALIAPDLPKSTTLPPQPGYLYLSNTTAHPGAVRSAWLLTTDEKIPHDFPEDLQDYNADIALAQYPDAPLCPIAQRALAPLLDDADPHTRAAALHAELIAYLHGHNRHSPAQLPARVAPDTTTHGLEGMAARFAALPGPLAPVVPIRPQPDPTDLSPNQRAVLTLLHTGTQRTNEIATRSGLSEPAVSKILASLRDKGHADKHDNRWHPTTTPTGASA